MKSTKIIGNKPQVRWDSASAGAVLVHQICIEHAQVVPTLEFPWSSDSRRLQTDRVPRDPSLECRSVRSHFDYRARLRPIGHIQLARFGLSASFPHFQDH